MKAIVFHGHSLDTIRKYPHTVKREVGHQLDRLQRGLDPVDWKPMTSIGSGMREIRIHCEGQYRIIYVLNVSNTVTVLHAFQKKTGKTAKADIDKARKALKQIGKWQK